MPSERFFRLDKAKQEKIVDAARREFMHHPMEDVSINRIIRDAGISRGSFYTYFEDKQDVLRFLLRKKRQEEDDFIRKALVDSDFDIEEMLDRLLSYYIKEVNSWKGSCFRLDISPEQGIYASEEIRELCSETEGGMLSWLWEQLQDRGLDMSFETFRGLAIHFKLLTAFTALRISLYPEEEQETKSTFHDLIRIFREGVNKK